MKRAEAKALGLKFYNTGKPCKHGHLSDRYTSTAICVECVKLAGVDHILPLRGETVSGLHVPTNVQVIPKALNRRKRNVYHPN